MSRLIEVAVATFALNAAVAGAAAPSYPGVGRPATTAEVRAWDIDVRADLVGLPPGSGSVSKGQDVWDAKCAACHGTFGESNEVFTPIVGATTKDDIATGRVKSLLNADEQRTTLMKLSQISTLWDYVNRAMPWNAPKSLTTDEVYAVVAYILNLGGVVPDDYVLSDKNMREVQSRLPNRNGMTQAHGLWDVRGKPDVKNVACMNDCPTPAKITSMLPDYAKTAHGNLADQNRTFGPVRGQQIAAAPAKLIEKAPVSLAGLAKQSGCLACHGLTQKVVGPAMSDIAARYSKQSDAQTKLMVKVKSGGAGEWGAVPMPPQTQLGDGEIQSLVQWILGGVK
jgi:S-disulfanyl-L-cysteine oxidoreductase SoxD